MNCVVKVIKVFNSFEDFEIEVSKYTNKGYRPTESGARLFSTGSGGIHYYITMIKEKTSLKISLKNGKDTEDDGI